jgi:hypothetical protein
MRNSLLVLEIFVNIRTEHIQVFLCHSLFFDAFSCSFASPEDNQMSQQWDSPNALETVLCKSSYVVSQRGPLYLCVSSKVHAEPSRHSWIPPSSLPLAATSPIEDVILLSLRTQTEHSVANERSYLSHLARPGR